MSFLQSLCDVFVSPASLFARIKQGELWGGWIFSSLALAIFVLYFSFYSVIDSEWLIQRQLAEIQELPLTQREEMERIFRSLAGFAGWFATLFSLAMMMAAVAALSVYFLWMDSSLEKKTYKQWFVFTLWTHAPIIVSSFVFLVVIYTVPEQDFRPDLIHYSSVSQLFSLTESNGILYVIAEKINVFYLWIILITAVGLKIWNGDNFYKCLLVAIIPYALYIVANMLMV